MVYHFNQQQIIENFKLQYLKEILEILIKNNEFMSFYHLPINHI